MYFPQIYFKIFKKDKYNNNYLHFPLPIPNEQVKQLWKLFSVTPGF